MENSSQAKYFVKRIFKEISDMPVSNNKSNKFLNILLGILPIVVLAVIFYPVVFGSSIFLNGDTLFSFFYYFQYYAQHGPLVTQYILSGFPVSVSVTGVWFYPINNLMLHFFDAFDAYRYLDIINLLLTYSLTYLFARRLKFDHLTAVLTGAIFLFSGQVMLWSETLTNTNYYFVLPASLLLIELATSAGSTIKRFLAWAALGIILGLSWLSGHVQFVVYIHSLVAIYFLFLHIDWRAKWVVWRSLVKLVLAYAVSAAIGWSQISVILAWRSVSARSGGVALADYFQGAYYPWDLARYFWPFFTIPKIPFSAPNLYIGILPVILLIGSLVCWRWITSRHFRFFLATFLFCLIASAQYSPTGWLLHQLPLFDSFREGPRMMFMGNFAAAIMVAYFLNYWLAGPGLADERMKSIITWLKQLAMYVLFPLTLIMTLIKMFLFGPVLAWSARLLLSSGYGQTIKTNPEYYLAVLRRFLGDTLTALSWNDPQIILSFLFLGMTIVLFNRMRRWPREIFLVTTVVLVSLNFLGVYFGHYHFLSRAEMYRGSATARFIKSRQTGSPERHFSIFPGATIYQRQIVGCGELSSQESFQLSSELILPNLNMQYGLDSIAGYDNFMTRRTSELLAYVGSENSVTGNLLADMATSTDNKIAFITKRKSLLRMMNVKYLISSFPIDDSAINKIWSEKVGKCAVPVAVYELADYWPRYYLIDHYKLATGTDNIFSSIVSEIISGDGKPMAILEENLPLSFFDLAISGNRASFKELKAEIGYDTMTFNIDTLSNKLLVIGNAWLPGWRAYINGRPIKIYRANYVYMAIPVPVGKYKVTLKYENSF